MTTWGYLGRRCVGHVRDVRCQHGRHAPGGDTDEPGRCGAECTCHRLVRPAQPGPDLGGDKVLIHSATGGVGQAAIAIARAVGAEIFATAGSETRRNVLRDTGIDHVYDSRSADFAEAIRRDTDGYGVDIVLNSLTGAAQRAGLELLSFGGRFVEIGKRDIYGDTRMGLFPFRRNLSFHAVDLALLTLTEPDTVRQLLEVCFGRIADGTLPLPETTHYPLQDGATAIRVMVRPSTPASWCSTSPEAARSRRWSRRKKCRRSGPTAPTS